MAAYSAAASFRYSHYFVSFLSECSTLAAGIGYQPLPDGSLAWWGQDCDTEMDPIPLVSLSITFAADWGISGMFPSCTGLRFMWCVPLPLSCHTPWEWWSPIGIFPCTSFWKTVSTIPQLTCLEGSPCNGGREYRNSFKTCLLFFSRCLQAISRTSRKVWCCFADLRLQCVTTRELHVSLGNWLLYGVTGPGVLITQASVIILYIHSVKLLSEHSSTAVSQV